MSTPDADFDENEQNAASSLPSWAREEPNFSWEHVREEREALSLDDQILFEQEKFGAIQYGVNETPELIATSLQQLEEALDTIPEKETYETALFIDPEYVESEEFRLAFLRADLFNVPAAARRMVNYWERKLYLFGPEKAFNRSLSILDLKEEDYIALGLGAIQLIPHLDEAGRGLIFKQVKYFSSTADSMHRLDWYVYHIGVFGGEHSVEIQKNGFVNLGLFDKSFAPFESISEMRKYIKGLKHDTQLVLPMRGPMGLHFFASNNWAFSMVESVLDLFNKRLRSRLTMYDVSEEETETNMVDLSLCGIRREIVPAVLGGYLDTNFQEFLTHRLKKELVMAGVDLEANPHW
eukprot:CAMPEP_0195302630 /NCGR_PEP_ID=MMETSP0707-20130614/31413_1 /TAXON_ID=33640 /ORGANISM="Asterionellopsis glacialis, Strain CCMP134" /LENGTH=350 /DNA_ID=CAMNT_0040365941 /DNA_START=112 /DNA_END=1161 /DNA_ORIENTATION=+